MPNRIIKESICRSDQINDLTAFEEVLFYRLMVCADDYGRFDGRIAIIKNTLFPLKDGIRADQIEKAINTLSSVELVERYEVAGKPFVRLTGWDRHQSIRAKKSKYPSPVEASESNAQAHESICKQMQANVPVIQSNPNPNPNPNPNARVERASKQSFSAPSPEMVRDYCNQMGITGVDPQAFVDYYDSKDWMVGRSPMTDWHAAVRKWSSNEFGKFLPKTRVLNAQNYSQRQYTEDELGGDAMRRLIKEAEKDAPSSHMKTVNAQRYTQRQYTEDELGGEALRKQLAEAAQYAGGTS